MQMKKNTCTKKYFKFTKRQWSVIITLATDNFWNAVCIALLAPFYPQEAEKKGCTATEYGFVFGIFELTAFIISPIYGAFLNKIGIGLLFNGGIITTGVCSICFGFLTYIDGHITFLSLSLIIRIIQALGNAAFLCSSFTVIGEEFPDNVATMFASLATFFGLGLIAGPTVGGALYSVGGYTLPFIVVGIALLLSACGSYFVLPKNAESLDNSHNSISTMISLLKIPGIIIAASSIIATSLSIGFLQATLEPHLRQFKFTPLTLGFMFVIHGGVYAICAPLWGKVCDLPRVHPKYVTIIGAFLSSAAFLLIGPAPFFPFDTKIWVTVIGLFLFGLGNGAQLVASFSDALNVAFSNGFPNTSSTFGLVSGMWTSMFALGSFIGPTVSGMLFDHVGFRSSTILIIVVHLLLGVLVIVFLWKYEFPRMRNTSPSENAQPSSTSSRKSPTAPTTMTSQA